jgi:hypothetical protein
MLSSSIRRYLIWLAIAAVLVALYAALGFLGVPRLVRSTAQKFVMEHYHRSVSIGEVHFNPFNLTLEVHDVSLPDSDAQPELGFGRLLVNLQISSLWRRGPTFKEIELERPFARVLVRSDGTLNLADLAKPFAEATPKSPPPANPQPLRLFIDRFAVVSGQTSFEDRTHTSPFRAELQPITFELRDFSTTGRTGNAYTLEGTSAAGEKFAWSGNLGLNPLTSHGHFDVSQLQARTVWTYLRESLPCEISSGVIGFTGDYDFTTAGTPIGLKIDVNKVSVADLGIKPSGGADDYVHFAHIDVTATRFDLAERSVGIGSVRVTGGDVRAWLDAQGKLNLLELTRFSIVKAPTPAPPSQVEAGAAGNATSPFKISAPDVGVTELKVSVEDRQATPAATLALTGLDAHVAGYSTAPDAQLEITANSTINGSAKISSTAKLALGSGATSAKVELAQFDLTALQPYVAQRTSLSVLSGKISTKLGFERAADGAFSVAADAELTKLRTVDNALKQDFIKWDQLNISGMQYRSRPASLRIRSIVARAPYARVIVAADRSLNVAEALRPASASPAVETAPPPEPKSQPMQVSIDTIQIVNGSANYADLWIQPNFAVGIQSLSGTIGGLSSDARSRAKVELNGKVDRYAPAHIWGEVNTLAATAYTDIKMSFHGMELTTVTPYSGHFAGYKIEKGKLSVDLSYHVEKRQLQADHRFVIDQLQLGEKVDSPDAVKLPLKLAVALLKDRNGVIDIGLPVTGSLDDPKFRLGPIIWKAVVNLLTKIATAPFALLGQLFGGGAEMNLIDFDPGSATLDAPGKERINGLIKALKERPQLELDVPATFSPDLDRPYIAAQRLHEKLIVRQQGTHAGKKQGETTADQAALADPAEHFHLLVAEFHADFGKDAPLPPLALAIEEAKKGKDQSPAYDPAIAELETNLGAQMAVSDADLEALGQLRARAIQDALLGGGEIDATRVFVINGPPKPATGTKVRVEMSLK